MEIQISDLHCIDFEASSLSLGSWPIEVGIAWIEGAGVQSWSSLIQPDPLWDTEDWSQSSAEIHNISLEELRAAPTAVEVAEEVKARLIGKTPISDNPDFEARWMRQLLALIDAPCPEFLDYELIVHSACHGHPAALGRAYQYLRRSKVPHRAQQDAERLAKGLLRGLQVVRHGERLPQRASD